MSWGDNYVDKHRICLFEKDQVDGLEKLASGQKVTMGEPIGSMKEDKAGESE
ncbi:hypothetical protein GCM10023116_19790 [Kistimonas scapharcae]|uniref:Uncharacterized protein n=1 Tax=Kistimonas scapharcae TaxID=1036133 RepID=A0ABP8V3R1_9GAMM